MWKGKNKFRRFIHTAPLQQKLHVVEPCYESWDLTWEESK